MREVCKDKWIIINKHMRVLKLNLIEATLIQDWILIDGKANGDYIVRLKIVGFGSTQDWKISFSSWEEAQIFVEDTLLYLSKETLKDLE